MSISKIRAMGRNLPAPIKTPLIPIWEFLVRHSPAERARRRWVTDVFSRHNLAQRERLYLTVANFAHTNRPINGYYFEFGCNQGNTIRMAFDSFRYLFDWHYVAFDSFEGLPDIQEIDRQEIWQKGFYKTTEEDFRNLCLDYGIPADRLTTIKGFYDDSLNEQTRARLAPKKAAFIYIDCDLYYSTIPVLNFCRDFLQVGTVIAFDDWNCFHADPERGERRAWREFLEREPHLRFEKLVENGHQAAFVYVGNK